MKRKDWILQWHNEQFGTVILCKDGMWRKTPDYGDYKECMRTWSSANWALRACKNWHGEYTTIKLSEQSENLAGQIR